MNKKELLMTKGIPPAWWDDCYISDDGEVFTPRFDRDERIVATGLKAYEEWTEIKNKLPDQSPIDVMQEESRQSIVDKDLEIIELRRMLTDLDLTVRGGDSSGQIAD